MAQSDLGTLVSSETSGDQLAAFLRNWRDALHSMHSGTSRPSYAKPGMLWIDVTATPWVIKLFTGSADVAIAVANATSAIVLLDNADRLDGYHAADLITKFATESTAIGGTGFEFIGVPTDVNEITLTFVSVSLSRTADLLVQVGDSTGFKGTGSYLSYSGSIVGTAASVKNSNAGFIIAAGNAGYQQTGSLTLHKTGGNRWVGKGTADEFAATGFAQFMAGHTVTLANPLDRIRLISTGADTFDNNGGVNINFRR